MKVIASRLNVRGIIIISKRVMIERYGVIRFERRMGKVSRGALCPAWYKVSIKWTNIYLCCHCFS